MSWLRMDPGHKKVTSEEMENLSAGRGPEAVIFQRFSFGLVLSSDALPARIEKNSRAHRAW